MGVRTITKDFAAKVIEEYAEQVSWKDELMVNQKEEEKTAEFEWTPEARKRVERAPEGYMRDCTVSLVEQHARGLKIKTIDLEIATAGIEKAKVTMEEAMKNPGKIQDILANLMAGKTNEVTSDKSSNGA